MHRSHLSYCAHARCTFVHSIIYRKRTHILTAPNSQHSPNSCIISSVPSTMADNTVTLIIYTQFFFTISLIIFIIINIHKFNTSFNTWKNCLQRLKCLTTELTNSLQKIGNSPIASTRFSPIVNIYEPKQVLHFLMPHSHLSTQEVLVILNLALFFFLPVADSRLTDIPLETPSISPMDTDVIFNKIGTVSPVLQYVHLRTTIPSQHLEYAVKQICTYSYLVRRLGHFEDRRGALGDDDLFVLRDRVNTTLVAANRSD